MLERLNEINIELLELVEIDENWSRVVVGRLLTERLKIIEWLDTQ